MLCHPGDDTDPEFGDEEQICSAESDEERSDNEGVNDDESGADGEEQEDEAADEDDGDDGSANTGWAQAMAKILAKKTPASKSAILLKNKELERVKEKEKQEQLERKKQVIPTATEPVLANIRGSAKVFFFFSVVHIWFALLED